MCKYTPLKIDIEKRTDTDSSILEIDKNGTNQIYTEAQAAATISHAGRFIIFGVRHDINLDPIVQLMPELVSNRITIFGLELPPSMNGLLAGMQEQIDVSGLDEGNVGAMISEEFFRLGLVVNGDPIELGKLIVAATHHGIEVIAIDPRLDNEEYLQLERGPEGSDLKSDLSFDSQAAENAATKLSQKPRNDRMAIVYGHMHVDAGGQPGVDRPPILREALLHCGSVTSINLFFDSSDVESYFDRATDEIYLLNPVRPQNRLMRTDLFMNQHRRSTVDEPNP